MHFSSVTVLAGSLLVSSGTALGGSILAFAPVTALDKQYALQARHIGGSCPAASQTSCADGLGCCPSGAACTYSGQLPVCDELCGSGPKCSNGGCCQAGYFCGVTNNFCTPSPTGIAKMPTFSAPVNAPVTTQTVTPIKSVAGSDDNSSPGATASDPTATSTSTRSTRSGGGGTGSSRTPSNTAGHSRTSTSTSTKSTTTGAAGGGGVVVAKTSSRATPTPTSTGAASSLDAASALAVVGFGWITLFFGLL